MPARWVGDCQKSTPIVRKTPPTVFNISIGHKSEMCILLEFWLLISYEKDTSCWTSSFSRRILHTGYTTSLGRQCLSHQGWQMDYGCNSHKRKPSLLSHWQLFTCFGLFWETRIIKLSADKKLLKKFFRLLQWNVTTIVKVIYYYYYFII